MARAPRIRALAADLVSEATAKNIMIAAAESCTGGMIAAAITDIAGSSAVFDRGFVTYSNEAKTEMLGVSAALIARHGAVSAEVAAAMAEGALMHSRARVAVSVTGVAGPTGGTDDKPVGLVWFALARKGATVQTQRRIFPPGVGEARAAIRTATARLALKILAEAIAAAD